MVSEARIAIGGILRLTDRRLREAEGGGAEIGGGAERDVPGVEGRRSEEVPDDIVSVRREGIVRDDRVSEMTEGCPYDREAPS